MVSLGLWSLVWVQDEYSTFKANSELLRENYIQEQRKLIKTEISNVVTFIQYMMDQTEIRLKDSIQEQTESAYSIATNIYHENKGIKSPDEIKKMIKDALRPVRFNSGRGYYFAFDLHGIGELFADKLELEGTNMLSVQGGGGKFIIKDMIALAQKKGQGFYQYSWSKPTKEGIRHSKVAYVKLFKPFGWVLGTGEYLNDVKEEIQKEVLKKIITLRFGGEGYFFGSTYHGNPLFSNGKITKGGESILDLTDPSGIKIIQEQQRIVKIKGGGFVNYSWKKLDSPAPSPKTSYVHGIAEWEWMIGAGVYIDSIESIIANNKAVLKANLIKKILTSFLVLLLLILFVFFWARHISNQVKTGIILFSNFFRDAASHSVEINISELYFVEFRDIANFANKMLHIRKQADDELRKSEERYRRLTENAKDMIFRMSLPEGVYEYVSPATEKIFGYTPEEFYNSTILIKKIIHPKWLEYFDKQWELLLDGILPPTYEYQIVHKSGETRWINQRNVLIKNDSGQPIAIEGIATDITESKKAEEEKKVLESKLAQAQKMESIGLMAGGVAHDLNNILSGVVGYPELLLMKLPKDSELRKPIKAIQDSGNRAVLIIEDLLTVARGVANIKEKHNLNSIIEEYLESPEFEKLQLLHPEILFKQQLEAQQPWICCSSVHIKKCLMNLVTNAAEAIEGEGTVIIFTSNRNLEQNTFDWSDIERDIEQVILSVQDSGAGISDADLKHIFDPFYSKKALGRSGTGLGLTIVWNTMEDHRGKVTVENVENGTCFQLSFPLRKEQKTHQKIIEDSELLFGNEEHILVVDDEPQLRDLSSQMLRTMGYVVASVASGEEAIAFLKETPVDLVLLDMLMEPGMNGSQAYEEIIKLYPGQKAIIASGFSESDNVEKALKLGASRFIKKPYSVNHLSHVVKETLRD